MGTHAARRQRRPERGLGLRGAIMQNVATGMKKAPSLLGRAAGQIRRCRTGTDLLTPNGQKRKG
jgi:hypothetical protein